MNKFVKWTSVLSMVGVIFLSSGCSCSVKQDKIDASADSIKTKKLFMSGDNYSDFTSTYKITEILDGVETTTTIVVKRDVDGKRDVYEYNLKRKVEGEEVEDLETRSQEVYVEGTDGKVYIKEINDNINNPYLTSYTSPSYVYTDAASFVSSGKFPKDYYYYSGGIYEIYKYVPYNGCSSASKDDNSELKKQLPDIASSTVNTVTCEVEKELFGKDYTYTLFYRVNVSQLTNITIVADKENRITSIRREDSIGVSQGNVKKVITEFNVSYDDVKN